MLSIQNQLKKYNGSENNMIKETKYNWNKKLSRLSIYLTNEYFSKKVNLSIKDHIHNGIEASQLIDNLMKSIPPLKHVFLVLK